VLVECSSSNRTAISSDFGNFVLLNIIMFKNIKSILRAVLLNILGSTICVAVRKSVRDFLHFIPMSARRGIIRSSGSAPLWFTRFLSNLATNPIGEERKWIHRIKHDAWRGNWVVPNLNNLKEAEDTALSNDVVILYIHGGGFCLGHSKMHMETFQLIINHLRKVHQIQSSILSLEYSLSPENVWPKACDEAMASYQYLIDLGISPSKIILAGESAGGNLVATMLLTIKNRLSNEPEQQILPAAAALFSPWIDLTINQPSFATLKYDILTPKHIAKFVSYYIPNFDNLDEEARTAMIRNPLISPLHGDFSGTCRLFLSYGENEMIRSSIEQFKSKLERNNCNLTLLRGERAGHAWFVSSLVAESKQVYEKDCKSFINWIASVINNKEF